MKKLCETSWAAGMTGFAVAGRSVAFLPVKAEFKQYIFNLRRNNTMYMNSSFLGCSDTPIKWWQIAAIGIIIFLGGIDAFFWTSMFLGILIPLFGILALVVGIIMIAFSLCIRQELVYRFPIFLAGIISLVVAALAILVPGLIQPSFIIILAILAIINSILLIIVGCSLADEWKTRLVIVLFGMLTLFLSILIALFPSLSDIALVKIWGIYAGVIGLLCIAAGLSMKFGKKDSSAPPSMPVLP
jgi:uncharacterized membrane protein HdeD (DUF308 family)